MHVYWPLQYETETKYQNIEFNNFNIKIYTLYTNLIKISPFISLSVLIRLIVHLAVLFLTAATMN